MPRYFFHVENGHRIGDEEGEELADDEAARSAGVQILAELLEARRTSIWNDGRLIVHVETAGGERLFTLLAEVRDVRRA